MAPATPVSADEARRRFLDVEPLASETVALADAHDRVLARALTATFDLPAFARAAMDGFAVRCADLTGAATSTPVALTVVGTVAMGTTWDGVIGPGQAVEIATGGVLPAGADAVVMVEHTRRRAGDAVHVDVEVAPPPWAHVVRAGDDVAAGSVVVAAGRRLRPQDVAGLAAFGATQVEVFRRPRVAVLSTGNELVAIDRAPTPGQIRDVNQWGLGAAVASAGGLVTHAGLVPDDRDGLVARLRELLGAHDVVVMSGGSSVGVRDVSAPALASLGQPGLVLHGIAVRPGKPTLLGRVDGKSVVGLPGNPTASLIVFDAFVRPMLARLGGEAPIGPWPRRTRARIASAQGSVPGREDWLRVRLEDRGGVAWAQVLPGGPALLSTVLRADGLVRIEAERSGLAAGDDVEVLLY